MKKSAATVLLNWNGWRDTLECLDSLLKLSDAASNLIVIVDNASSDDSIAQIKAWFAHKALPLATFEEGREADNVAPEPRFVLIQANCNGGFARGNNVGIRYAQRRKADYVWLLNNDTVVEPDTLSTMIEKMESDKGIGICGSILRYYDNKKLIQAVGGVKYNFLRAMGRQICEGLNYDNPQVSAVNDQDLTYVSGASMLTRLEFLEDVGLMEESYFLYYEEIDWMSRAGGRWRCAFAPESVVYHKEGGSIGTQSLRKRSLLSQYYLNRNLIRYAWLRRPSMLPIAVARGLKEILNCLLQRDFARASTTTKALIHGLALRKGPVKGRL